MKAALYIRVSTQEQATEGYSLDAQLQKLTSYANYMHYEISGVYRDEGQSAASTNRPELKRLLRDISAEKVDCVLIYKLDRLSRRVRDVIDLVEIFEKHSVSLYSLTENLDLSSPFGRAALKMSATFSELERETIIERSKLGKEQRIKSGSFICTGKAPFGYRADFKTKSFHVDEKEAETVKKLFELYLEGSSFRQLQIYAKSRHPDKFNSPSACRDVIKRMMYCGMFVWKGKVYEGKNFPPLISRETYFAAQRLLTKSGKKKVRDNTPYLLCGKITCGKCGSFYVGKLRIRNGKHDRTYICKKRLYQGKDNCSNKVVPAEIIEREIISAVKKINFVVCEKHEEHTNDEKIEKLLDLYLEGKIEKFVYEKKVKLLKKAPVEEKDRPSGFLLKNIEKLPKNKMRKILNLLINKIQVTDGKIEIFWNF